MTTPLTDPENVLFELYEGFTEDEAYAFLAGVGLDTLMQPITAAADVHTGAMIALIPTEDDAQRLALTDYEVPEQLHLTLVYLGDAVDFSAKQREQIIDAVRRYAVDAVTARAFAVNVFNPDGVEPALVLGVGNDGGANIEQLRSNIYSAVRGLGGVQVAENHTPWIPHITLAYADLVKISSGKLLNLAAGRLGPVKFDRVRVAFGGENTDVPLSASVSVDQGGDDVPWEVRRSVGGKYCVVKKADSETVACHDTEAKAKTQLRALYASESSVNLVELGLAVEAARERDVNAPGGGHDLRNYWVKGPGAVKIRWGTDGSFARCVANLSKYVKNPQGLCAEYHKAATGEWPAEKGVESSVSGLKEFHGSHNQQDHDPHKGFHVGEDDFADDDFGPVDQTDHASDLVERLRSKNLLNRHDIEWTGDPKADPDTEIAAIIREVINEETTEDSARSRLKIAGVDMLDVDLDYLTYLFEQAEAGKFRVKTLTAAAVKKKKMSTQQYSDEPWEGILAVEGVESGDSRLFSMGSLDWAELPLPLMYQPANIGGHNGSFAIGDITHVGRRNNEIYGWGTVFGSALASEHGDGIRNTMKVGGVSVDVDSVKDANVEMVYSESSGGANPFAKPELTIFHEGRVRGATLVAFPAFVEAKLHFTNEQPVTASGDCGCGEFSIEVPSVPTDGVLTASSHTITIPNLPKAEWFNEPTDVQSYGALTITDEGRVFGVVAPPNTTHRSVKRQVPRNVDFSRFHKAETIVEGGERVVTGVITADCGHARTEEYGTLDNRRKHYDNSCSVLANVRVGYAKDGGIWCAGALNPGARPEQVAQALGCTLSLDVQPHPDRPGIAEFIAAHLVPVPGFPLARSRASVQYSEGVLAAAAVPVEFTDSPHPAEVDVSALVAATKLALAQSIGRDPTTRKNTLMSDFRR